MAIILFTLSKDDVGSGVSHGPNLMGKHPNEAPNTKFTQTFLLQLRGPWWPVLIASAHGTHETKVQSGEARNQNSHRK